MAVYKSLPISREYGKHEQVLGRILEDKAEQNGERVFLRFQNTAVSYREVNERANRLGNAFRTLGVENGENVLFMLPNCLETVYTWFGLNKIGAVEVPLNTAFKGDQLSYQVNQSTAKVLVIDAVYLDRIRDIRSDVHNLETIIVYSPDDGAAAEDEPSAIEWTTMPFARLLEGQPDFSTGDVKHSDLAAILYTSGTTGPPKGVMCSHSHFYMFARTLVDYCQLTSEDIFYTCMPFFHANAQVLTTYPALLADAEVVISPRFSASGIWDECRASGATIFNTLGAMINFIWQQAPRPDDADNPVRRVFAVPRPHAVLSEFSERFGVELVEAYGGSEANCIVATYGDEQPPPSSCGKALPFYEVKIVDPDDDGELPPMKIGEFVSRSAGEPFIQFSGYWNMPEKTVEVWRNGWFHSGDAGYMDKDGWCYFVDRIKDCIRRRGENISSYEIEKVIDAHPDVLESAAMGVKAEAMEMEDEVKVCACLRPDRQLAYEDLLRWCEDRMAYFMVPRYVEYVTDLPKTETGKIQKEKLRSAGITPNTWDREEAGYTVKRN
jgi:crotonobetaine/carnitine-CoA ligase